MAGGNVDAGTLFKTTFGHAAPHFIRIPGCLTLLGTRAEQIDGLALTMAVEPFTTIAASARRDGRIVLMSTSHPDVDISFTGILDSPEPEHWAFPIKQLLAAARKQGIWFGGFNAVIDGTLANHPAGWCAGFLLMLRRLFPFEIARTGYVPPVRRQEHSQSTVIRPQERRALGILCRHVCAKAFPDRKKHGILEVLTAIHSREWHAMEVDCQEMSVEQLPFYGEHCLVAIQSGMAPPALSGRSFFKRSLLKQLGIKSLRRLDTALLQERAERIDAASLEILSCLAGENCRVAHATRALREEDFASFGHLMTLDNPADKKWGCPPGIERLINMGKAHPACLGARWIGGNTSLHLVRYALREKYIQNAMLVCEATGLTPVTSRICKPVAGLT